MLIKQIRYAMRDKLSLRISALAVVIVVNIFFSIFNPGFPIGLVIAGVSLSGVALGYLVIVNAIVSVNSLERMFSSPGGYSLMLAPVPAWKILLGRAIAVLIFDVPGLIIGTIGVMDKSFTLTNMHGFIGEFVGVGEAILVLLFIIAVYFLGVMVLGFWLALSKSIFFTKRFRGFITTCVTALVLYLMSWIYMILAPLGVVIRYGCVFYIELIFGMNLGTFACLILLLAQAAALFFATSRLMERKINL